MRKSVLVVDDEIGYRQMYQFLLEPLNIDVESACEGNEALEKIKKKAYDLVLMDVHMPVMSGPEALREIKKVRPNQKVVIVSSSSDPEQRQENQALKEGAIQCCYKPLDLSLIESLLIDIVNS